MSYALHIYFLENHSPESAYNSVRKLFQNNDRIVFVFTKNIFTKKDYLKLTIDNRYNISIFFDEGMAVSDDLEFIFGKRLSCSARMRFLFAPDPENDFDDISVIILDYLQSFNEIIIYNTNQNKIIFNSSEHS